jgi:hypothetical protein
VKAANKVVVLAKRRRQWPAVLALLTALATAGGLAAYWAWWPQELCHRWEARVAEADDASLPAAVEGLDRCGRHAVRPLVRLLASTNRAAADAGSAALDRRIRRIRSGAGEPWTEAAELAEALRQSLESAPADSQPRHVRLAMDLLETAGRLSIDYRVDESARGRITVACENVLRYARAGVEPAKFVAENAAPLKSADRSRSTVRQIGSDSGRSQAAQTIPIEAPSPTTGGPVGPMLNTPRPLPTAMPAAPVRSPPDPSQSSQAAPSPRTAANASARVNPIRQDGTDGVRPASAVQAGVGFSAEVPAAALASRTAWALFADLASDGPAASLAAAELHRRGFRPAELELGRQFAVAASEERVRLAESLPFQTGIDVRPWLVHLADDDDPAVRLAVVTIMGTTNDPQMLARLRQLALSDPDENVRSRARKLSDTGRTLR